MNNYDFPLLPIIDTKEEAHDCAVAWQEWQGEQSMSWSEVAEWQAYFQELADKYDLTDEFKENGII